MELCKVNGNLSLIMFGFGDKYFVMMSTSFSIFNISQLLFRFLQQLFFWTRKIFIFWFRSNFQIQSVPWDTRAVYNLNRCFSCIDGFVWYCFVSIVNRRKIVWKIRRTGGWRILLLNLVIDSVYFLDSKTI